MTRTKVKPSVRWEESLRAAREMGDQGRDAAVDGRGPSPAMRDIQDHGEDYQRFQGAEKSGQARRRGDRASRNSTRYDHPGERGLFFVW